MNTEVFNYIDLLVEMANSALNFDDVNADLITLKKQIKNKRNEIEDLKSIMTDARYFNASNELVDKNIEISLKNKISLLKRKVRDLELQLEEFTHEEEQQHEYIADLKERLQKNNSYLEILTKKSQENKDSYYKTLLHEEEDNVQLLTDELKAKEEIYQETLNKIEVAHTNLEELKAKLNNENERLNDVMDNLKNPQGYLNEELKNADQQKLKKLDEELEELENKRLELLSNVTIIGSDAKQLMIDGNTAEALKKIRELVKKVKEEPFMNITSLEVLNEELEKLEATRVELSNLIDNKKYEGFSSSSLTKRIEFLTNLINSNESKIASYKEDIKQIDEYVNNNLGVIIKELEAEINTLQSNLEEYQLMLKDSKTSIRSKANLENALLKKEKEKKVLNGILGSYKENLLGKIEETNIIDEIKEKLEIEVKKAQIEKENLSKLTMIDFNTKDLIEEERDKEKLRAVNEEIRKLEHRKKYKKTPDTIYDEIEMQLASMTSVVKAETKSEEKQEIDNLYEPTTKDLIKVIQMIPVETVQEGDETHGA